MVYWITGDGFWCCFRAEAGPTSGSTPRVRRVICVSCVQRERNVFLHQEVKYSLRPTALVCKPLNNICDRVASSEIVVSLVFWWYVDQVTSLITQSAECMQLVSWVKLTHAATHSEDNSIDIRAECYNIYDNSQPWLEPVEVNKSLRMSLLVC